jgi:predicted metal-binding membrane protein
MDAGPGAELGSARWFAVTWVLMMAAMMLPALVPAAPAFARAGRPAPEPPAPCAAACVPAPGASAAAWD